MHIEDAIEQLAKAERFSFRDWPNKSIPRVAAGVYAVYYNSEFIYVGMAGAGLTEKKMPIRLRKRRSQGYTTG